MENDKQRKKNLSGKVLFPVMICLLTICSVFLFFAQGITLHQMYPSDLTAYIRVGTNDREVSYSLFTVVVHMLSLLRFLSIKASVALLLAAVNLFSILVVRYYFIRKYRNRVPEWKINSVSVALFLISMIIIPFYSTTIGFRDYHTLFQWWKMAKLYSATGTPNPWHNPTYLFSRLFSILAFLFFLKTYTDNEKKGTKITDFFLLSLFSFLSMASKPSFLFAFIPACFLFFLIELFTKGLSVLKYWVSLGFAYIPSLLMLLWQKVVLFNPDEKHGFILKFGGIWLKGTHNILVSILLAGAFPIFIYLVNIKRLEIEQKICGLLYLVGALQFFMLMETGTRAAHGNFAWGYLISLFFVFLVSAEELFFRGRMKGWQYKVGVCLFSAHLVSGILYFIKILVGLTYS